MAGIISKFNTLPVNNCRIVLLGKTGSGKSSIGNSLLGLPSKVKDLDAVNTGFEVGIGMKSQTKSCEIKSSKHGDVTISVTDSPGLEDTAQSPDEIYQEIAKTLTFTNPGPHVILLVYKFERFTETHFKNYTDLKQLLGENIKHYIIVIFTHVENLVMDNSGHLRRALTKEITENAPKCLTSLLRETDNRYFPFNNTAKDDEMKQQVDKLFGKIRQLILTNKEGYFKSCYSDSINEQLQVMIAEKMKMSAEKRETKQKEDESQEKTKEFEKTKKSELEEKDPAARGELDQQISLLKEAFSALEIKQRMQESEIMRLIFEEIAQGKRRPPQITIKHARGVCSVM